MSNEIKVIIEQNRAISERVQIQTFNYDKVKNKPSINGVELIGDKTGADLGIEIDTSKFPTREELDKKADKTEIPDVSNFALKREIPTKTSQLENNSDFVNSEYVTEGLATKQDKGDYATNSRVNQIEASIPEGYDDTEIRGLIDEVEETSEQAKAIAEGKSTGYVFDTVDDMNTWLETNSNILKLGDNLYIRAVNVPDYWWDGEKAQQLETQKVDLSEYVKNTDYATSEKGGVVKTLSSYGISTVTNGFIAINASSKNDILNKTSQNKPIVPFNIDYAVKTGVTTNTIELTDDEKTSARTWLGAVGSTDYATSVKAGIVKGSNYYCANVNRDGNFYSVILDLETYQNRSNTVFISKGTLENVLTQYSKTVLTTEADYNALATKDANTLYLIEE